MLESGRLPGTIELGDDPHRQPADAEQGGDEGGRFAQRWQVLEESWIPLPGNATHWPLDVEVDGASFDSRSVRPGQLFVPIVAIDAAGGWDTIMTTLTGEDPALTDMFAPPSDGSLLWIAIASFVGIGLPFLGVPQLLVRYMSIREEEELGSAGAAHESGP